jgi:flagellar motor switch protein FliN/FliY
MAEDGPLSQADIDALTSGLLGGLPDPVVFDSESLRPAAELMLEQATSVLSTLLNKPVTLSLRDIRAADADSLAEGLEGDGLLMRMALEQGFQGELGVVLRKQTAALIAGIMMGGDGTAPFKDEDLDAITEVGNQFMGATCTAMGARYGHPISASQAQVSHFDGGAGAFPVDGAALIEADLHVEGSENAVLRLVFSKALSDGIVGIDAGMPASGDSGSGPSGALSTQGSFDDTLARNIAESPTNIQMLLDINLNVTIELGRTRLSIRKILELGPGSIIELDRLAGEPVDLLVNDKVVAKGEVVVVDEYFGIRIISLVSPEERIKQLR